MIQIGRKDVLWSYAATFLKITSSALLLPLILRMMSSETVGIWSIFMTITAFASLLDFGFNSSFTRNVTYVFSGIKTLKTSGFDTVDKGDISIEFGLLKGVISSMRWFYSRIAILLFFILMTLGTYYIYTLLKGYKGNQQEVYIAWTLLCLINTYNLYTLYYDSLLQGKGLVKRSKQIIIIGQTIYLVIAAILIMFGNGLVAIVSAQASSVIIIRWLSYRSFFNNEIKQKLKDALSFPKNVVFKAIYPNALKMGLTSLGGFMVQKSAIIIGSLYLPLKDIASYGITMQLIAVIAGLGGIYTATFQPKISQMRVLQNIHSIKVIYLKGQFVLLITYFIGGLGLLILGKWALDFIGSQTQLLPSLIIFLALIMSFVESNLSIAGSIILTKNEVPFFKASLISGAFIILGLLLLFKYSNWGIIIMIVVPLIVDLSYQAWKWPLDVLKDLNIMENFNIKNHSCPVKN